MQVVIRRADRDDYDASAASPLPVLLFPPGFDPLSPRDLEQHASLQRVVKYVRGLGIASCCITAFVSIVVLLQGEFAQAFSAVVLAIAAAIGPAFGCFILAGAINRFRPRAIIGTIVLASIGICFFSIINVAALFGLPASFFVLIGAAIALRLSVRCVRECVNALPLAQRVTIASVRGFGVEPTLLTAEKAS